MKEKKIGKSNYTLLLIYVFTNRETLIHRHKMKQENQVIHWVSEQKQKERRQLFPKPRLQNQRFQSQIRLPHISMLVLMSIVNQLDQRIDMAME